MQFIIWVKGRNTGGKNPAEQYPATQEGVPSPLAPHFVGILILGHPIKENLLRRFYERSTSVPFVYTLEQDVLSCSDKKRS